MGFFVARITETYSSELPPVEDGVIRGAKLLGLNSRNGRRYEGKALDAAKSLYEGRKVYVDHPRREDTGDRSFNDWAGVIENVTYRKGSGLYGDVVLRQESPYFKGIVEAASNPKFRKSCGFSHVADGESTFEGDTEIIESIKEVFSVDLVTDPATTAGIFESVKPTTVKEAIETLPDGDVRKRLLEMVDLGSIDGGAPMEGEQAPDPLSQMSSLVKELITMLGETLKALAMKKDTPAPAPIAPAKDKENGALPPADDPSAPQDEEKAQFEKMQRENAELKAKNLLLESGIEATAARIKALASIEDEAERKELLESWPVVESVERPQRSPALIESVGSTDFDFSQPGSFAARYR
jgi:hypothetical protein